MNLKKVWKTGRTFLLIGIVLTIGLSVLGCVKGLAPVGWSGGVAGDGKVFVGSREGVLVAINLEDLSRQKSEPLKVSSQPGLFGCSPVYGSGCSRGSGGVAIYGIPAIEGELVYMAGYNGRIYAYSTETLAFRWVYPREDYLEPIVGSVVAADGRIYFGDTSGIVHALDAVTGDEVWTYETGDKIWATPAVVNGIVYIGSFDKKLYALDAANGALEWEFVSEGSIISTPLVDGDTIYVGSFDRKFYALDTRNGNVKWTFDAGNWFWAKPVLAGNTIYAGNLDGKMYALNAANGNKVNEYDVVAGISSNPVAAGNSIIFTNREGVFFSIDTGNGQMSTLADIGKPVNGPILFHDGIIYVQTDENELVRIDASNGAIMQAIPLAS